MFIEWLKSISPEWWAVIVPTVVALCSGFAFLIRTLIKKFGCPIKATVQSLYVFDFEQGKKCVFDLLIQNRKDYPITISNIEYKIENTLFTDERNNEPFALSDKNSLHIIREYFLPLNTKDSAKHKFIFHINKKKYALRLFAQINNAEG